MCMLPANFENRYYNHVFAPAYCQLKTVIETLLYTVAQYHNIREAALSLKQLFCATMTFDVNEIPCPVIISIRTEPGFMVTVC